MFWGAMASAAYDIVGSFRSRAVSNELGDIDDKRLSKSNTSSCYACGKEE